MLRRAVRLHQLQPRPEAGAMLGPLLGGWLLQVAGFSTAFVTAGTLGMIAVLLFFLMKLPPPMHAPHPPLSPGAGARENFNSTLAGRGRENFNSLSPGGRGEGEGGSLAAVLSDMARGARTVVGNVRVVVTSATDGARQVANGALMAFLPIHAVGIRADARQDGG